MMTRTAFFRLAFVMLVAGSVLTACGKRGQLDAPPGTAAAPKQEDANDAAGGQQGLKPKRTPIVAPKRDLFIDPLLD